MRRYGEPKLRFLLDIGRQLKDLDIIGELENGQGLFAQVSHEVTMEKLKKLAGHGGSGARLFYFGPDTGTSEYEDFRNANSIEWISIEKAFDTMMKDQAGQRMLQHFLAPGYTFGTSETQRTPLAS